MSGEQTAGVLDRVFNSTISYPQQVLWRLFRIAKGDADLFSERGLLDGAMIPLVGVLDDHKEDVMPDYMAEELGLPKGFASELGVSIATDPLTYLTGGLTSVGKAGKAAVNLERLDPVRAAALTKAGGTKQTADEYLRGLSVGDMRKLTEEAIEGATLQQQRQMTKYLDELDSFSELDTANDARKIGDVVQETHKRQIAFGVPGLVKLGVKIDVPSTHNSWWSLFGQTMKKGAHGVKPLADKTGLLAVTDGIAGIPWVGAALSTAAAAADMPRQFLVGFQTGGEGRAAIANAKSVLEKGDQAEVDQWLDTVDGGGALIPAIESKGVHDLIQKFEKTYAGGAEVTVEEAFRSVVQALPGDFSEETVERLLKRLGADPEKTLARLGKMDPEDTVRGFGNILIDAITKNKAAQELYNAGAYGVAVEKTDMGKLVDLMQGNRSGKALEGLRAAAFKAGSAAKRLHTKTFISDTGVASMRAAATDLQRANARSRVMVQQMGDMMWSHLGDVAKTEAGQKLGGVEGLKTLLQTVLEGSFLPEELAASMQAAKGSAVTAGDVGRSMGNYIERQQQALLTLRSLLKDISDDGLKDLVQRFDQLIGSQIPEKGHRAYGAIVDEVKRDQRAGRVRVYSARDQQRLERHGYNSHILGGKTQVQHTMFPDPTSGELVPSPTTRRVGELDDGQVDRALDGIIDAKDNRRRHTTEEIGDFARQDERFAKAAKDTGLTPAQVAQQVGRRKTKLWGGNTKWGEGSIFPDDRANAALSDFNLRLEPTDNGNWRVVSIVGGPAPDAAMDLSLNEAMKETRAWLVLNEADDAVSGLPAVTKEQKKVIIALRKDLTPGELAIVKGKSTVFDANGLRKDVQADYRNLQDVKRARAESKDAGRDFMDPDYEGQIIVGYEPAPKGALEEPRGGRRVEGEEYVTGDVLTKDDTIMRFDMDEATGKATGRTLVRSGEYGHAYTRLTHNIAVLKKFQAKQLARGGPETIPVELLTQISDDMEEVNALIRNVVNDALPVEVRNMFDAARTVQSNILESAMLSGAWIPGSPFGYLGRYYTKHSRDRVATVIGEMDAADSGLLHTLGIKSPSRFGRSEDSMTVSNLNDFHAELSRAAASGDKNAMKWHAEIEAVMEQEGTAARQYGGTSPFSQDRLDSDPILSLVQRQMEASNQTSLVTYFDNFLAGDKATGGSSQVIGGTVVRVLRTDAPRPVPRGAGVEHTRIKGKEGGKGMSLVEGVERSDDVDVGYFVIRTEDGAEHHIPIAMGHQNGFGALVLGSASDEGMTVSRSFANASLRDDLINKFHGQDASRPMSLAEAEGLVGQHIVYGSRDVITGAVNGTRQSLRGAGVGVRTLDNVNYMIKSWQTIRRVPFHIANVPSGIFQSQLAGVGPVNTALGYGDALRALFADPKFINEADLLSTMLGGAERVGGRVRVIPSNAVARVARILGGTDALSKKMAQDIVESGLATTDDWFIQMADGGKVSMVDALRAAGEANLLDTYASMMGRGGRNVDEDLLRIRLKALDPDAPGILGDTPIGRLGVAVRKGSRGAVTKLGGTPGELLETPETMHRLATYFGLIREGHTLERAAEIARNAHVDYSALTTIEREKIRRVAAFYTFPRKYIPWAWKQFGENPAHLSQVANVIKQQKLVTAEEGKPMLKLGDYRLDLGRLNPNIEAVTAIAGFADMFALPAGRLVGSGEADSYPVDSRALSTQMGLGALTSIGGIVSLVIPSGQIGGDPSRSGVPPGSGPFEEARRMIWPIKYLFQGLRHLGLESIGAKSVTKEERSPHVDFTTMETIFTNSDFGLGVRKVRPQHEFRRAFFEYKQVLAQTKRRYEATTDPARRKQLATNIQMLSGTLEGIYNAGLE